MCASFHGDKLNDQLCYGSFCLKVHSPIFQNLDFWFHLKNHHSKDINWKFQLKSVKPFGCTTVILFIAVAYILLCKLNYGYHNQACFHWFLWNGTLFSREILHGLWEKYELSCDAKISKSLKKVEKMGLGSFNSY